MAAGLKVLVIEDDLHTRRMVSLVLTRDRMLRYHKLDVLAAANGVEGITLLKKERPKLVIMDLLLPDVDGVDLLRQIRGCIEGRDIPIILTSAVVRNASVLRKLERQFDVSVQMKPFRPKVLAERVRKLLRGSGPEREIKLARKAAKEASEQEKAAEQKQMWKPALKNSGPPLESNATGPILPNSKAGLVAQTTGPMRPPSVSRTPLRPLSTGPHRDPKSNEPPVETRTEVAAEGTPIQAVETLSESKMGLHAVPTAVGPSEGDIDEKQRVSALLLRLARERRTGSLDLRRDRLRKVVHLLGGYPIFVQSNLRAETLGRLLVKRGGLSEDEHTQVLKLAEKGHIKYGEALVKAGHMTESEVLTELVEQTKLKVQSCLRWPVGKWTFKDDPEVGSKVPHCAVDPVDTIFRGLHKVDPHRVLSRLFDGGIDRNLMIAENFEDYRVAFADVFGETVVDFIKTNPQLVQVLAGDTKMAVVTDALLQCGLATLSEPEGGITKSEIQQARKKAQTSSVPALERLLERKNTVVEIENHSSIQFAGGWASSDSKDSQSLGEDRIARALVEAAYLGLHQKNHYEVLGVIPDTDKNGIEIAHRLKRREFDLSRFRDRDIGEAYAHLEEICAALDEAYETLSNDKRRADYDASLGKHMPKPGLSKPMRAEALFAQGMEFLHQGEAQEAVKRFEEAIALDDQPEYRVQEALAFFISQGRTNDAGVEAMVRVQSALMEDPDQVSALLVAARISLSLGSQEEALEHLRDAVQLDPMDREAFLTLENVLMEASNFVDLEMEYRRAINAIGSKDRQWSAALWKRLVLLYRDRLKDIEKARKACDTAFKHNPDDSDLRAFLQDLVDRTISSTWPQAVLGYRALVRNDVDDVSPLEDLFRLHIAEGREDAAMIVGRAALWRGSRDVGIREFVEVHDAIGLPTARQHFDTEAWNMLRHEDDDEILAGLFSGLLPIIDREDPLLAEDLDLNPSGDGEFTTDFSRILNYVCRTLDVTHPLIVRRDELGSDIQAVGTNPSVLLVGDKAIAASNPRELAFRLGRACTLLKPISRLVGWRSPGLLKSYLLAAIRIVDPHSELPPSDEKSDQIERLLLDQSEIIEGCRPWIEQLQSRNEVLDFTRWQQGIQHTAERVGLVLSTDIRVAGQVLLDMTIEAETELLDFALSQTHWRLRSKLGFSA